MSEHPEFHRQTEERLLRYAAVTTQSKHFDGTWPTTACQRDLAKLLFAELHELGVRAAYDEARCVVYGWLPAAHVEEDRPIALIAHMDTAPDVKGRDVKPWVLRAYPGGDILLNEAEGIVLRAADYPNLAQYIGQDLVLTDGTTLLGGDDKAAIAALMTLAEYYASHPEQPHRTVCLAFTPDEEVGGLARDLDLERLGARFAYTIDGDHLGWYQDQTFNACEAAVTITGRSVHPATAKGIMVNATDLAVEFLNALPPLEKPQFTDGVDGFYYVTSLQSDCERAVIRLIVRDFDRKRFQERQDRLLEIAHAINERWGQKRVLVEIHQQYRNMGDVLEQFPFLVSDLEAAIRAAGLEPKSEPFRGGTDGSALSFRGLPSPNLSAGYENAHGRFEFVPVPSMAKNVEILIRLTEK
ncbi:MAG: peptidase T [Oscillospiraceae bacterium]|nr:peptidase T [Oscillospiraceae bacterium]